MKAQQTKKFVALFLPGFFFITLLIFNTGCQKDYAFNSIPNQPIFAGQARQEIFTSVI